MRIISGKTLKEYYLPHPETEGALKTWYHEVCGEAWKSPQDVLKKYPKARPIPGNRVIFNIMGNKYRLIVAIHYASALVFIRFIGTHKEYDSINAEEV